MQWQTTGRVCGCLVPAGAAARAWCERLQDRELAAVTVERDRSDRSHRHQFALIRELWLNLPETLRDSPWAATPETARKHALIACGFCHSQAVDAGSKAAAERVAPFLAQFAHEAHGYAITSIKGPIVTVFTPMSQSARAMGHEAFQRSKNEVILWLEAQLAPIPW